MFLIPLDRALKTAHIDNWLLWAGSWTHKNIGEKQNQRKNPKGVVHGFFRKKFFYSNPNMLYIIE